LGLDVSFLSKRVEFVGPHSEQPREFSMTAKSQPHLAPTLLRNQQYSGTVATLLYNWPIFVGILLFSLSAFLVTPVLAAPWHWLVMGAGLTG
jgi:hypothetical protein